MNRKGWLGRYGFYEAIDFSSHARVAWRDRPTAVKQWMAHHQGMSVLAIGNLLKNGVVRNWFHSDAHVLATELLLQERPMKRMGTRNRKKSRPTAVRPKQAIAA